VDGFRDAARDRHAARTNAHESQFIDPAVAFENFVRDSREAAGHPVRVEDDRHMHLFAASQGRVKERRGL